MTTLLLTRSVLANVGAKQKTEHVYASPTPWVNNTHPKIAVIVKERK